MHASTTRLHIRALLVPAGDRPIPGRTMRGSACRLGSRRRQAKTTTNNNNSQTTETFQKTPNVKQLAFREPQALSAVRDSSQKRLSL